MDGLNVAAKLLADDVVSQQLLFDPARIRLRFVALVHRHDDRHCRTTRSAVSTRARPRRRRPGANIPLALLACRMDSTVWFMTPSSAATTRMTMSVALAPRALMEEKAA